VTPAAELVAELTRRGLTLAVAESLTGGALASQFVAVPGASAVVLGGVVAYQTELKHTLLGVDAELLARHGPVHPDVAGAMARGVREVLAVGGRSADIGLATTGVAGPEPQGGSEPGTVFIGLAVPGDLRVTELSLEGDRQAIRNGAVSESLALLGRWLAETRE
jgi:nicotinamide-nucleotide amidase